MPRKKPFVPEITQLTPVLMVSDVDKTADFYCDLLGFERGASVETDGKVTFLILSSGSAELMLQSDKSMAGELPKVFAKRPVATTILYMDVDDVERLYEALQDKVEILKPLHYADHGQQLFYLRDPNGYVLGFAQ